MQNLRMSQNTYSIMTTISQVLFIRFEMTFLFFFLVFRSNTNDISIFLLFRLYSYLFGYFESMVLVVTLKLFVLVYNILSNTTYVTQSDTNIRQIFSYWNLLIVFCSSHSLYSQCYHMYINIKCHPISDNIKNQSKSWCQKKKQFLIIKSIIFNLNQKTWQN